MTRHMGSTIHTPKNLHVDNNNDAILETYDDQNLGFLRVTVDREQLHIEYQPASSATPKDSVTVDLKTRQLVAH